MRRTGVDFMWSAKTGHRSSRFHRIVTGAGQDRQWRREMIDHVAMIHPGTVLDVATGPAGVALELADRTEARITGIDLSEEMLGRGRRNVAAAGRDSRIGLVVGQRRSGAGR